MVLHVPFKNILILKLDWIIEIELKLKLTEGIVYKRLPELDQDGVPLATETTTPITGYRVVITLFIFKFRFKANDFTVYWIKLPMHAFYCARSSV